MEHVFVHPRGFSGGAVVAGERVKFKAGQRVPFGPDQIEDERDRERVGQFLIPASEYTGRMRDYTDQLMSPVADSEPEPQGPEWARLTVVDLAQLGDGYGVFSKSGLAALCEFAGVSSDGTTGDLRDRLEATLEGEVDDSEEMEFLD